MKKSIIFGVNSQDGYYLSKILARNQVQNTGVSRSNGNWTIGNVADKEFVESLIKSIQPNYIFHLAANSTTRHEAALENMETILAGCINILETVKNYSPNSRVFFAGSGVQFKNDGTSINEDTAFEASSGYSVARIGVVYASRYYRLQGIKVYIGYLFHHESPLRKPTHVSMKIIKALNEIKKGKAITLELGDIQVKKEWAFAEDVCEGIFTLVNQEKIYEACIGTGMTYSIKDWLDVCFKQANLNWKDYVILNNKLLPEYKCLYSDPTLINSIGWFHKIQFEELSHIMVNNII